MPAKGPPRRLRFGVFEVDLRTGELTKRGLRVRLRGQPFQVLAMLLETPGELVTREELRSKLWPRTIVDFDHGLNKAISEIREALGDSGENPRFIETVARRGYRFLGDVTPIDAPESQPDTSDGHDDGANRAPADLAEAGTTRKRATSSLRVLSVAAGLVAAAFLSWTVYSPKLPAPEIHSLVVLPLENLSGDPSQDYFADGMTDELIADLGRISTLRVISRTSAMVYKGARKPLPEIASELNVEAVVEGSVLRSSDRVRITAQLIEVPADKHIWSQSYEGDLRDTLAVQNRVARAIAEQVHATLSRREQAALDRSREVKPEAYEAYLRGRYLWNRRTADGLAKSIDYFKLAADLQPTFAEAHTGLADAYALSGDWEYGLLAPQDAFSRARAAATRALALDDNLSEAHTSLAFVLDLYAWDWKAAEQEYERAILLNPGYATAHQWYAWHLIVLGRIADGIAELRRAENLDPLSAIIGADLADALSIAHLYDDAIRQSRKTLELHPNFAVAYYEMGQALAQQNKPAEAIAAFQRAIDLSGGNTAFEANLGHAYAVSGRRDEAIKMIKDLEVQQTRSPSTNANIALIYVGLNDNDQAIGWLEKAYAARFNPSILLRPGFDPIRSDARFQDLLHRIGISHG